MSRDKEVMGRSVSDPTKNLLALDAALVAYRQITAKELQLAKDLDGVVELAAIALSMVVPVYDTDDGGNLHVLSAPEVNDRFFSGPRNRSPAALKGLLIREDDLARGIKLLKDARVAFRSDEVLYCLKPGQR